LLGLVAERMRFFRSCRPAIRRKLEAVWGRAGLRAGTDRSDRAAGVRDVLDIQTSTGTFFAAGLATAQLLRAAHSRVSRLLERLDFETKILGGSTSCRGIAARAARAAELEARR